MNTQTMYENWKVSQEQMRTPSPPAGSESCEAEHTESEEDPVWLYPGDDGWHEAAPIFVIGYRDEETDEDAMRQPMRKPMRKSMRMISAKWKPHMTRKCGLTRNSTTRLIKQKQKNNKKQKRQKKIFFYVL